MACGIASSRSACQFATSASAPELDAWEKEEELAATRRGVNAFWNVPIGDGDNSLWEMLRDVHFLLDAAGADDAAKAYMLVEDITKTALRAFRHPSRLWPRRCATSSFCVASVRWNARTTGTAMSSS